MPDRMLASPFQQTRLQHLRETMRRAGVPEEAADQVVAEEEKTDLFSGYVWGVHTGSTTTTVQLRGSYFENKQLGGICGLLFPPNDPRYLAEILRAQNHPHFRIHVSVSIGGSGPYTMIRGGLQILLDYDNPKPIEGSPPFDLREIAQPKTP